MELWRRPKKKPAKTEDSCVDCFETIPQTAVWGISQESVAQSGPDNPHIHNSLSRSVWLVRLVGPSKKYKFLICLTRAPGAPRGHPGPSHRVSQASGALPEKNHDPQYCFRAGNCTSEPNFEPLLMFSRLASGRDPAQTLDFRLESTIS